MASVFTDNLAPVLYTAQRMLEMQEDLKLKKGFKVRAVSVIESRFPSHFEMFVETDDHKQYVQLWKKLSDGLINPSSAFTPVLPPGGKK